MPTIASLRYINADHTFCEAVMDDGKIYHQVGLGGEIGELIAAHVAAGNKPAPFVAPAPPTPPTPDEIYDRVIQTDRTFKALVLALNDGTFPVGTNKTGAQIKAIIKAKM